MEVNLRLITPENKTVRIAFNRSVSVGSLQVEASLELREKIRAITLDLSDEADLSGLWSLEMEAVNTAGEWHGWVESDTCSDDSEFFSSGAWIQHSGEPHGYHTGDRAKRADGRRLHDPDKMGGWRKRVGSCRHRGGIGELQRTRPNRRQQDKTRDNSAGRGDICSRALKPPTAGL
jgi:hypothetical protein